MYAEKSLYIYTQYLVQTQTFRGPGSVLLHLRAEAHKWNDSGS